jgi:hypothetical protein
VLTSSPYMLLQSDSRGVTLEGAMALYNLENFELLWERKLDTKALMAWNDNTVVLSFRGTASFRNVLADIKVRRTHYAVTAGANTQASQQLVADVRSGQPRCSTSTQSCILQAWYAVHPPKRGKWWATTRPFVHQVSSHTAATVVIHIVLSCTAAARPQASGHPQQQLHVCATGLPPQLAGEWLPEQGGETHQRDHLGAQGQDERCPRLCDR